jgi:hypothetical protein
MIDITPDDPQLNREQEDNHVYHNHHKQGDPEQFQEVE